MPLRETTEKSEGKLNLHTHLYPLSNFARDCRKGESGAHCAARYRKGDKGEKWGTGLPARCTMIALFF